MTIVFALFGLTISLYCSLYFYQRYKFANSYELSIYNAVGTGFWLAISWLAAYQFWIM